MELERQDSRSGSEHQAIVEQSIVEGIRHVLGESGLKMILSLHPINQLSFDAAKFHEVLKGIFMDDGAAIIEREIGGRLLEKIGSGRRMGRRSFLSRIGGAFPRAKSPGATSTREKDVLRQFLALASLQDADADYQRLGNRWTRRARSSELNAPRLGIAF